MAGPLSATPRALWRGLYGVVAGGLALRVTYALLSESAHHPDEVFQYLEQGHRLAFGYGLVPWEYRFGVRSWLVPLAIAAPLYLCRLLGVDDPAIYVPLVKGLFCLLSVWLIVSVYRIGRNLVSETAGRLAAVFAAFWYELVYFAPRPLTDVVAAYFLVAALAGVTDPPERRRPILLGLCVAGAVALRLQYLPVAGFLLLLAAGSWSRPALGRILGALAGGALLVGALDRLTWGSWFASYYNAYVFNVTHGISSSFSTMRPTWYVSQLGAASGGVFVVVGLLSLAFARRLWVLLVWILAVVGSHSLLPHKEYRFVFAALPVLLVMTAAVTTLVADRVASSRVTRVPQLAVAILALVSVAGMLGVLPRHDASYPVRPLYARQDELRAFAFLSRQLDLAGVWLSGVPWWGSGGYYYLHRDVPLYLATDEEVMRRQGGPRAFASHVVCPVSADEIPGFVRIATFGGLEVRKQLAPPALYATLPSHTKHILQPNVDGVFHPSVTPRF